MRLTLILDSEVQNNPNLEIKPTNQSAYANKLHKLSTHETTANVLTLILDYEVLHIKDPMPTLIFYRTFTSAWTSKPVMLSIGGTHTLSF